MSRTLAGPVLLAVLACGGAAPRAPGSSDGTSPADRRAAGDPGVATAEARADDDARLHRRAHGERRSRAARPSGWSGVSAAELPAIEAYAGEYAAYLAGAKTPRRAIAGLIALYRGRAAELKPGQRPDPSPGTRYWLVGPGGSSAAFVMVGDRPIEDGARIVVAGVDAPRIELKPSPVRDSAGFGMLDTVLHGDLDPASWLSQPLALYVHAAGAGGAPARDLVIGEADDDPILVIPDLLPHLARRVQRPRIVDDAERLDAIAASSRRALVEFLAARGLDEPALSAAEASLVPAGPPAFLGVDRALLAGYGHSHRALAYAAVRALADAERAPRTAIAIAIDPAAGGADGLGFVAAALSRVIASLSARGEALDVLDTSRIHARSAALVSARLGGTPGRGLALDPRADDALPPAIRRVLGSLDAAGAQYQVVDSAARASPSRTLATLGVDSMDVGVPTTGHGAPREVVSTLDLYQALLGTRGWLTGP